MRDVLGSPHPGHRRLLRPRGLELLEADPSRSAVARVISVTMKPGAMALAVTPNLPSSMARVFVKPAMPAFAAA